MASTYRSSGLMFLTFAVALIIASVAVADPVAIAGAVRIRPPAGSHEVIFAPPPYTGQILFHVFAPGTPTPGEVLCTPCSAGDVLNLSYVQPLDGSTGSGNLFGEPFEVAGSGFLEFAAPPVVVPPPPDNFPALLVSVPFTATGFARFTDQRSSRLLFEDNVVGSGVALLVLSGIGSNVAPLTFLSAEYRFDDTRPTPEPGTWLLFGSGFACLVRCSSGARCSVRH